VRDLLFSLKCPAFRTTGTEWPTQSEIRSGRERRDDSTTAIGASGAGSLEVGKKLSDLGKPNEGKHGPAWVVPKNQLATIPSIKTWRPIA
jgi:hypothetical protein